MSLNNKGNFEKYKLLTNLMSLTKLTNFLHSYELVKWVLYIGTEVVLFKAFFSLYSLHVLLENQKFNKIM